MYEQEIKELIMEWVMLIEDFPIVVEGYPISLVDYIKLRSQNGSVKFIKDEDWEIIKNQRTKLSAVDAKLESIEGDFK